MAHLINPKTLVTISDYHMVVSTNIHVNRMFDDGQVGNIGEYAGERHVREGGGEGAIRGTSFGDYK
jgi:hypothetical protein